MTGVVAYLAMVVASAALLCGHQGVIPPRPRRGTWRGLSAPHRGSCGSRVAEPGPKPSDARTAVRPHWAHTQPLAYEETA